MKTNVLKRTLASILSCSLLASSLALQAFALNGSSGQEALSLADDENFWKDSIGDVPHTENRTPFTDWADLSGASVYEDGITPNTDWFTAAAGTEDDPFIISSAADLAGITELSDELKKHVSDANGVWTNSDFLYVENEIEKNNAVLGRFEMNLNNATFISSSDSPYDINSYYNASWSGPVYPGVTVKENPSNPNEFLYEFKGGSVDGVIIPEVQEALKDIEKLYMTVDEDYNLVSTNDTYTSSAVQRINWDYVLQNFKLTYYRGDETAHISFTLFKTPFDFDVDASLFNFQFPASVTATNANGDEITITEVDLDNYYIFPRIWLSKKGVSFKDDGLTSDIQVKNDPGGEYTLLAGTSDNDYATATSPIIAGRWDLQYTGEPCKNLYKLGRTLQYYPFGTTNQYAYFEHKNADGDTDKIYYMPFGLREYALYVGCFANDTNPDYWLYVEQVVDITDENNPVLLKERKTDLTSATRDTYGDVRQISFGYSNPNFVYDASSETITITFGSNGIVSAKTYMLAMSGGSGPVDMTSFDLDKIVIPAPSADDLKGLAVTNVLDDTDTLVYDPDNSTDLVYIGNQAFNNYGSRLNGTSELNNVKTLLGQTNISKKFIKDGDFRNYFKITCDIDMNDKDFPMMENVVIDFGGHTLANVKHLNTSKFNLTDGEIHNIVLYNAPLNLRKSKCYDFELQVPCDLSDVSMLYLDNSVLEDGKVYAALTTSSSSVIRTNKSDISNIRVAYINGTVNNTYDRYPYIFYIYGDSNKMCKISNITIDADTDELSPTRSFGVFYEIQNAFVDDLTICDFNVRGETEFCVFYSAQNNTFNNFKCYISNSITDADFITSSSISYSTMIQNCYSDMGNRFTNATIKGNFNGWHTFTCYGSAVAKFENSKISINYAPSDSAHISYYRGSDHFNFGHLSLINSEVFLNGHEGYDDTDGKNWGYDTLFGSRSNYSGAYKLVKDSVIKATKLNCVFPVDAEATPTINTNYYIKELDCSSYFGSTSYNNGSNYRPFSLYNVGLYAFKVHGRGDDWYTEKFSYGSGSIVTASAKSPAYNLTLYADNVDGVVPAVTPIASDGGSQCKDWVNADIYCKITGDCTVPDTMRLHLYNGNVGDNYSGRANVYNSRIVLQATDSARGKMLQPFLAQSYIDTFVYADLGDNLYVETDILNGKVGCSLISTKSSATSSNIISPIKNATFVLPRYNVDASGTSDIVVLGTSQSDIDFQYGKDLQNVHILGNFYFKNTDGLNALTLSNYRSVCYNVGYECNFFKKDGASVTALEVPMFTAIAHNYTHTGLTTVYNCYCKTNVKAEAAIFTNSASNYDGLNGNHSYLTNPQNYVIKNCYFALSNPTTLSDLSSANGITQGFVAPYSYGVRRLGTPSEYSPAPYTSIQMQPQLYYGGSEATPPNKYPAFDEAAAMAAMQVAENAVGVSNLFVPEGNSAIVGRYFSDTDKADSYSLSTLDNATIASLYRVDPTKLYPNRTTHAAGFYTRPLQDYDYDDLTDNERRLARKYLTEVTPADEINGKLAYLLDQGESTQHRGREWTVTEEMDIVDPYTGDKLCTIPIHLDHVQTYYDRTLAKNFQTPTGDLEQREIFKYTVDDAADGYIKIQGLNDTVTTDGTVYTKADYPLIIDQQVNTEDTVLVYATQQFPLSSPSRIPNQVSSITGFALTPDDYNYNVVGYEALPMDTNITPVFKTARYITVNITGDEHGTLVPETYVSAEGEEVKFKIQADPGYTIINIKLDGVPLASDKFIMPDADVELTGECVPVEGAILKFKLLGSEGEINQLTHTIKVTVPRTGNIGNARPEITWIGDTLYPAEGARVDFSNADTTPVVYTVTYGDPALTTNYDVYVYQTDYTMRIYDFVLEGVHGEINHGKHTIDVVLPAGTDLRNLTPEDIVYSAENISPAIDAAQDFRVSVPYTLSTAGMESVTYLVNVRAANMGEALITQFDVSGFEGEIDQDAKEITLTVPEGIQFGDIKPSMVRYVGREIGPSKAASNDLSDETTYTVYAQDGTPVPYLVRTLYYSLGEAIITEFELAGYEGIIDQDKKTITVYVPGNLSLVNLVPDKITWRGDTLTPGETEAQDFSDLDNPVHYLVTAYNGAEADYTVIIKPALADLIRFNVMGIEGQIDQDAKTVLLEFPYGFNPVNTVPSEVAISEGATISPTATTPNDFTVDQLYTVTSANGLLSNTYTVHSIFDDAYDNRITKFRLGDAEGVITDIGNDLGTIYVTVYETPTKSYDISDIAPDLITISDGAVLTPDDDLPRDFTAPIIYNVYGKNTGDRKYYVYVTYVPLDKVAIIDEFSINDHPGTITQPDPTVPGDTGTIVVYIPITDPTPIDNVQPDITWRGDVITPDDNNSPQDFSDPDDHVYYTVTAEDPNYTTTYEVIIKYVECIISEYEINDVPGVIDQNAMTITVELPWDTDVTNLTPSKVSWIGDTITPGTTETQDFTDPVIYTVFADADVEEERVWKNYTVTVILGEQPPVPTPPPPTYADPKIFEFYLKGEPGIIDQTTGDIVVYLPYNADVVNIPPDRIVWQGTGITPTEITPQDFTTPTEYTVVSGPKSKTYTVTVVFGDAPPESDYDDPLITEYWIDGVPGTIDQGKGTITVRLPYGTDIFGITPDKIVWQGSDLTPGETDKLDFSTPQIYMVYSGPKSKRYVVTVILDKKPPTRQPTPDPVKNPDPVKPKPDNPPTGIALKLHNVLLAAAFVTTTIAIIQRKKKK